MDILSVFGCNPRQYCVDLPCMRVFITGISGLLGTHLAARLLREGHTLYAPVRSEASAQKALQHLKLYTNTDSSQQNTIFFSTGSLSEPHTYREALAQADVVVHAAGLVSFDPGRKKELYETNVKGTEDLVNAALAESVPYFVHISSVAALSGKTANRTFSEIPLGPPGPGKSAYATSKYLGEREVWRGMQEGLQAVILNPSVILGFHDWQQGSSAMFQRAWKGLNFYTHGATGFVTADDVVEAIMACIASKISEERFIISAENLPFRTVFQTMAEAFHKAPARWYAGPLLTALYTRAEAVMAAVSGRYPLVTRESAASAHAVRSFDNSKSLEALHLRYTPVLPAVQEICKNYLNLI